MSWSKFLIVLSLLAVIPVLVLLGTTITDEDGDPLICKNCWIGGHHHHASEVAPWRPLHRIARAQAHYLATDPDGKGRQEYWRKDIAGLWATPGKDGHRIGLILMGEAFADDHPAVDLLQWGVPQPINGYQARALLHEDEAIGLPSRFAACTYPTTMAAGKWTYIVDEGGVIYRKDLGPGMAPAAFPRDPLASGWATFREVRY